MGERREYISSGGAGEYNHAVESRETACFLNYRQAVPRDTDYASVIRSDQPIVMQQKRLDSRRGGAAQLSTTAYS